VLGRAARQDYHWAEAIGKCCISENALGAEISGFVNSGAIGPFGLGSRCREEVSSYINSRHCYSMYGIELRNE
jgi:hypothetical protein